MSGEIRRSRSVSYFCELIKEEEVLKRFGDLVGAKELRDARRDQRIVFTKGKKGMVLYHPSDISDFLERKVSQCQQQRHDFGNTAAIGSAELPVPNIYTPVGGTSEQDERAAAALTRKFSPKLKSV